MTNANTLMEKINALWSLLEYHYGPTLTDRDLAALRALDDRALDGKLTDAQFASAKSKLMEGRRRTYAVDNGSGRVDAAFWAAPDEKGKTNLHRRKSLSGSKGITWKGRKFVVKVGKTTRTFDTKAEAHLFRDAEEASRAAVTAWTKNQARDLNHEEEQIKRLTAAKVKAEERKKALRDFQEAHPEMSWSQVLRHPQFAAA